MQETGSRRLLFAAKKNNFCQNIKPNQVIEKAFPWVTVSSNFNQHKNICKQDKDKNSFIHLLLFSPTPLLWRKTYFQKSVVFFFLFEGVQFWQCCVKIPELHQYLEIYHFPVLQENTSLLLKNTEEGISSSRGIFKSIHCFFFSKLLRGKIKCTDFFNKKKSKSNSNKAWPHTHTQLLKKNILVLMSNIIENIYQSTWGSSTATENRHSPENRHILHRSMLYFY